ncbi:MAG: HAD family hydrolase [Parabacteroides sp.]
MKKLVIFDLDGTLLDTIDDLAASTNYALQVCGFPAHEVNAYRYFVGNGITKLFERALPEEVRTAETVARIRSLFVPYYDAHNADQSHPYPGMVTLLTQLQANGVALAVASNKYQSATEKLVTHFFPGISFVKILGQREGIPAKPDPGIVNEIMVAAGVEKEDVLYVGDSNVDMQTAQNGSVDACGVTWGFRSKEELAAYHPALLAERAEEISAYVLAQ